MQRVGGAARLMRVITHLAPLLLVVEHLDGRVHVQNPGPVQHRVRAGPKPRRQPVGAGGPAGLSQSTPRRALADHLLQSEYLPARLLAAQPGHVRIATVPGQDREKPVTYARGHSTKRYSIALGDK